MKCLRKKTKEEEGKTTMNQTLQFMYNESPKNSSIVYNSEATSGRSYNNCMTAHSKIRRKGPSRFSFAIGPLNAFQESCVSITLYRSFMSGGPLSACRECHTCPRSCFRGGKPAATSAVRFWSGRSGHESACVISRQIDI